MPPKVHFHKRREKYVLYFPYSIYFEFEVNLVARVFLALTRIYFLFSKFSYFESVRSHPSATHKIYQNIPIFLSTLIAWHRNYNTVFFVIFLMLLSGDDYFVISKTEYRTEWSIGYKMTKHYYDFRISYNII